MKLSVYWDVTPLSLVLHHIHEAIKLSHNLNTHTSFEILNLTNSVSQSFKFETQQCYVRLYNVRHLVMSMLIKIQPDATVCRYLFTAKSLYMFRVSQHSSSGVLKTVTAASGTGHNTGTSTSLHDLYRRLRLQFLVLLMMGAVIPETCRVTLQ